jgi:6-phosphogluconolactonase
MPAPRWLARFNRSVTNRAAEPIARQLPGMGLVGHIGRKHGQVHHTPVLVFRSGDDYVIALIYGAGSEWVRNVFAAGSGTLETKGRTLRLAAPRLVHDELRRDIPPLVRFALRRLDVADFVYLSVANDASARDHRETIGTESQDRREGVERLDSSSESGLGPITPPTPERTIDLGARGQVIVVDDGSTLARAAAERFADAVERAVAERGTAYVALSGGSTPKQMGNVLTREPYRSRIPWDRVQIFWGDERWVPLASPESNAGEAMRGFLNLVPIPRANVHPWDTEAESPAEAAEAYGSVLRDTFAQPGGMPRFDLVLLGMGDDGHTASLFPQTDALRISDRPTAANYVPKLDANRLTLTYPTLNAGREIVFLVGGPGKATTLDEVLEGPERPVDLPSQGIRPSSSDGELIWLVDRDAAAQLKPRDA